MIPLYDNIPSRTFPIVNYSMIAVCAVVFFLQATAEQEGVSLVERYGMIPARVADPQAEIYLPQQVQVDTPLGPAVQQIERPVQPSAVRPILTLLTCVFLHGGFWHFAGNMWFLHIFGDNVEDRMGHAGYLVFYLAAGIVASLSHLLTNAGSPIPTIGASGAIAGVMGAYFYMYPKANVVSVLPILIFIQMLVIPAPIFLGFWFVMQLFSSLSSGGSQTGVAWWAHIGGFVMGLAVAKLLDLRHHLNPPVQTRRAHSDHPGTYRITRHQR